MPKKYANLKERILANTLVSEVSFYRGTPCWDWIGATCTNRSGKKYGKLQVRIKRGRNKGKNKTWLVHRLVLVVFKGRKMTQRMVGRHLCNNTLCANPAHLVGGSQKANMRQCVREKRHRNGSAINCMPVQERVEGGTYAAMADNSFEPAADHAGHGVVDRVGMGL